MGGPTRFLAEIYRSTSLVCEIDAAVGGTLSATIDKRQSLLR